MQLSDFDQVFWIEQIQDRVDQSLILGQPSVSHSYDRNKISAAGDSFTVTTLELLPKADTDRGITFMLNSSAKLYIERESTIQQCIHDSDKPHLSLDAIAGRKLTRGPEAYTAEQLCSGVAPERRLGSFYAANTTEGRHTVFEIIVQLSATLDAPRANAPRPFLVIGERTYSALKRDPRFQHPTVDPKRLSQRNGFVGHALEFDVLLSPNTTDGECREVIIAGQPHAFVFASRVLEPEVLRDPLHFASVICWRHVYGVRVTNPYGLATAEIDFS